MADMQSLSSWSPQETAQPEPPIAQAPMPKHVISRSLFPSFFRALIVLLYLTFIRYRIVVHHYASSRPFRPRTRLLVEVYSVLFVPRRGLLRFSKLCVCTRRLETPEAVRD